uniref:L1 transposable element RRM domain-containing protein n=1 Tax=Latimeria chalumnae TaxID=7897 RepID=H3A5Z6_LATCH
LVELMQRTAEDVATIRSDIAEIRGGLDSLSTWVGVVETKLGRLDGEKEDHEARISILEENLAHQTHLTGEMWDKIQDLENRSRRNNTRVLGIPEGIEGNGVSGPALLLTVLRDCLPLESAGAIEVEHAHRTLGPRPPPDQRPRPIIARLLRFQDQERILRLAREVGELRWRGRHVMIFPDMSRELAAQRKLFTPARHHCMELGLRYALQYPATLRVTIDGKQCRFEDPEEAIQELNRLPDPMREEEGPQPRRETRRRRGSEEGRMEEQ